MNEYAHDACGSGMPWRLHLSLGEKYIAMAEWKTENFPVISGHFSRSTLLYEISNWGEVDQKNTVRRAQ